MTRETVDALLTGMLQSAEEVSDLLFLPGKPPLVEVHGRLHDFPIDTPESVLDTALIQEIAGHVIKGAEPLHTEFTASGSCDCGYPFEKLEGFRVNVYRQNGRHSVVMRKLA